MPTCPLSWSSRVLQEPASLERVQTHQQDQLRGAKRQRTPHASLSLAVPLSLPRVPPSHLSPGRCLGGPSLTAASRRMRSR